MECRSCKQDTGGDAFYCEFCADLRGRIATTPNPNVTQPNPIFASANNCANPPPVITPAISFGTDGVFNMGPGSYGGGNNNVYNRKAPVHRLPFPASIAVVLAVATAYLMAPLLALGFGLSSVLLWRRDKVAAWCCLGAGLGLGLLWLPFLHR